MDWVGPRIVGLYWAAHDQMGFDAAQRSDMLSTVEALRKIEL